MCVCVCVCVTLAYQGRDKTRFVPGLLASMAGMRAWYAEASVPGMLGKLDSVPGMQASVHGRRGRRLG